MASSLQKNIGRIASLALSLGVLVLAANVSNGNISFKKGPDAIASATVKNKGETASLSGVSGNFVILINKKNSPADTLDYFTGKTDRSNAKYSCHVPKNDEKAKELAYKMCDDVYEGDALILLSKAEYGDFDILILSKKTADIYTAKSLYDKADVSVVELKGE